MNVIQKSIADVMRVIPRPILETVFTKKSSGWKAAPINLEDAILHEVIRPRVWLDCNLVGGHEVYIPLEGIPAEYPDPVTTVYRIPKTRTNGRTIVSPLNISLIDPTNALATMNTSNCGVSAYGTAMQSVMDSQAPLPIVSTANIRMLGENVLMIRDTVRLPTNSWLRCIVTHDDALSHILPRSYRAFCKLVEYAVKSHIFNEHNLELDNGEIRSGHSLGRFAQTVESYSDAEELYQSYITETWQVVSVLNDRESVARLIKLGTGGMR